MVHTDLVHVEQREKFLDFFWFYQVLFGHVPVSSGHLILHLIHSSWRGSNTNTAGLVKAHRLHRKNIQNVARTLKHGHECKRRRGPHLPCFSLQALVQLKTVIVDLLEVDAWVVISCQTRLVQGKESAILDVMKHSPTVFSGDTGSMQAPRRVRMPLNRFERLPGDQSTSGQ